MNTREIIVTATRHAHETLDIQALICLLQSIAYESFESHYCRDYDSNDKRILDNAISVHVHKKSIDIYLCDDDETLMHIVNKMLVRAYNAYRDMYRYDKSFKSSHTSVSCFTDSFHNIDDSKNIYLIAS